MFSRCVDHTVAASVITFWPLVFGGMIAGELLASRVRLPKPLERALPEVRLRRA